MKNQYVILTGAKHNAGDHLIKRRAQQIFSWLRPDRKIINLDGWKKFTPDNLKTVNESLALLLVGGPALQNGMYPNVYALTDSLEAIKPPIITMGIGWYSKKGTWEDTHHYFIDDKSKKLLRRIEESGYLSSVRDYHTLNVLQNHGLKNFIMTGCPALYEKNNLNNKVIVPKNIKKIGFSLGVTMKSSKSMFEQMQNTFLMISELYPDAQVEVVFHHSPTQEYLNSHGVNTELYNAQKRYLDWIEKNGFKYVDISGSADKLIEYYLNVDLHIGYRVHAHIFMSSISKPSILLSEDGRGKGLEKVIGGLILDAYDDIVDYTFFRKVLRKLHIQYDEYKDYRYLTQDLKQMIEYETKRGIKLQQPRVEIDRHFEVMKKFIEQLP